jgi:hypothetical protein
METPFMRYRGFVLRMRITTAPCVNVMRAYCFSRDNAGEDLRLGKIDHSDYSQQVQPGGAGKQILRM